MSTLDNVSMIITSLLKIVLCYLFKYYIRNKIKTKLNLRYLILSIEQSFLYVLQTELIYNNL